MSRLRVSFLQGLPEEQYRTWVPEGKQEIARTSFNFENSNFLSQNDEMEWGRINFMVHVKAANYMPHQKLYFDGSILYGQNG